MLKVMLINPPQKHYKKSAGFCSYFPLGLLYIASGVKEICNLKILDCLATNFTVVEKDNYIIYGTPFSRIKEMVEDFSPNVVGITVPSSAQSEMAKALSNLCKTIDPETIIVFGGPDASVRYEKHLMEDTCDYCVVGEGEETFFEFITGLQNCQSNEQIPGLATKRGERIVYTPREPIKDLDQLPYPAYDLINFDDYLCDANLYQSRSLIKENSISIISSRGCPFSCIFCSVKCTMGGKFRYHSAPYVVEHLKYLVKEYGIKRFHFEDGNATLNRRRYEQILEGIIDEKLDIKWDIPDGVRVDTLDEELLRKMKAAGCIDISIGVESANDRVLNEIIKKNLSLEKVVEIASICQSLELQLNAFYIIGFPGETIKEMEETIDFALNLYERYQVTPYLFFATPLYGTELYHICLREGIIGDELTDEQLSTGTSIFGDPIIQTNEFSKTDLKKLALNFILKLRRIGPPLYIREFYEKPKLVFGKGQNKKGVQDR